MKGDGFCPDSGTFHSFFHFTALNVPVVMSHHTMFDSIFKPTDLFQLNTFRDYVAILNPEKGILV